LAYASIGLSGGEFLLFRQIVRRGYWDASLCVDCLEEVLGQYGKPDIFNSGQGLQFLSLCGA
jgi:hypothetical protein